MQQIYLWEDLSEEKQKELLTKARVHNARHEERFLKERALLEAIRRRPAMGHENAEAYWSCLSGERVNDLKDGWCRIFALNKFGVLMFYGGTRIEEEWLGRISSDARGLKDTTKWPRGSLPKGNPWKNPHLIEVQVLKPSWHEEHQQFSVSFKYNLGGFHRPRKLPPGDPRRRTERTNVLTTTWWFKDEFVKDPSGKELLIPRKQSKGVPWQRGGTVIRHHKEKLREVFNPDDYDFQKLMEVVRGEHGALAVKGHLIRKLRRQKPEAVAMEVKAAVEEWLEAIGHKI